jgi:4-alpha-glucanotransferase
MKWRRASGILVHPTSFPGRFGIGDLGPGALQTLDFLAAGGQKLWQVLPLGPTGYADSPYSLLSAFAGNPLLISPERLLEAGLLTPADLDALPVPPFTPAHVDYATIIPWKVALLHASYQRFRATAGTAGTAGTALRELREEYARWCASAEQSAWLEDYALFMALKARHGGLAWVEWAPPYAEREPAALEEARRHLVDEIDFHRYTQFLFFRQWAALRAQAHQRRLAIIGDLALFVAHDSADVWAHRDLFKLDGHGRPTVVAGVPPDYFSATGQRWGTPIYRWDVLAATGYTWWIARVRQGLVLEDLIRLDHFRGFEAYWEIPAECPTAITGRWMAGPRDALFAALQRALGDDLGSPLPFIAEDLGLITRPVRELQRRLGFPGMRVLQFGFGGAASNRDLPHTYPRDCVVYTGTHDNDTTAGWFAGLTGPARQHVLRYLHTEAQQVPWAMLRAGQASVARRVIAPLQDVLGLGSQARMNVPARTQGNWAWRATAEQLTPQLAEQLAELTALYGR